jgi:hypothetical protein
MAAWHESKKNPLPRLLSGKDLLAMGFNEGPFSADASTPSATDRYQAK